ncbi:MAG: hypothetical protein H6553_13790 [Chitinophagales bacterium]|nr:hypothetical protein [Chitinophagales bacterium]
MKTANSKQQTAKLLVIVLFALLTFNACKKEEVLKQEPQTNLTAEQQHRAKINQEAALLMAKIVKDLAVRQEIYQSVRAITSKHEWRDEAVYFKEILPNKWNTILDKPSKIAEAIYNELGITANANARTLATQTLIDELVENDVEFYFPYHEDYPTPETFAVTYQDEIKEEENDGWKIEGDDEEELAAILVNETLALQEPVLVIGQFDNNRIAPIEIYEEVDPYDPNSGSTSGSGTTTSSTSTILDPMYVNLGRFKYTSDHEGFLMGGPEFRFYIAKAPLNINNSNSTVNASNLQGRNFSRKDKGKWFTLNYIWDHSWNILEFNQVFGIYEDDGGLKEWINLNINVEAEIAGIRIPFSVNINIGNKDDHVGHTTYDRIMFYNTNKLNSNLGNGTEQSWPIYNMNGVQFTLPIIY